MRHYDSTFFCDKGCVPKVSVKRTGNNSVYEAYIDVLSDDGIGRQLTIFFATVEDLREFCKNIISEIADLSESGVRG